MSRELAELPAMTQALAAADQVRAAAEVLSRVHDIQVQVRVAWQQFGPLAEGEATADLQRRLAAVAEVWAKEHSPDRLTDEVFTSTKLHSSRTADFGGLDVGMMAPAIWRVGDQAASA